MSNDKTTAVPSTPAEDETPVVEKQSFLKKTGAYVKAHKKPALAVGALVALTVASAAFGRKTAPDAEILVLEVEVEGDESDSNDSVTA